MGPDLRWDRLAIELTAVGAGAGMSLILGDDGCQLGQFGDLMPRRLRITGLSFGGGIAPSIAGHIAQTYGIQHVLTFALCGLVLGVVVCSFLRETAPKKAAGADTVAAVPVTDQK